MISALLSAACVYLLFLTIHWIPFRLRQIQYRTRTMTLVLMCCLPAAVWIYPAFRQLVPTEVDFGPVAEALFYFCVFTLLWCGYVQFVFSFDTSPSLRALVVLLRNSATTESEIKSIMNFPDTFRRRFFRAVDGGAIVATKDQDQTTYVLSSGSRKLAKIGKWAKNFFRLGAGG